MTTTLGGHMRLLLATLTCCVLETTLVQAQNRELGAWVAEAGVTSFQGGMKDTAGLIAGPGPGAAITVRRLIPLGGLALGPIFLSAFNITLSETSDPVSVFHFAAI